MSKHFWSRPIATISQEQRPTGKRDTETSRKKKKKESQQPSPKERGWGDRDHKAGDGNTQKKEKEEGLGTAKTRAQHTGLHCTPETETAGGKQGAHATTHVP